MSQDDYIHTTLSGLEQSWQTLLDKQAALQQERNIETRAEEKFRLDAKLEEVQQDIAAIENRYKIAKTDTLKDELATLRRNKAYQEALDVARQIQTLLPDDPRITSEISELQSRLEQGRKAQDTLIQLSQHFTELSPIINDLVYILSPRNEHDQIQVITNVAQIFLSGNMDAPSFISFFQKLLTAPPAAAARATSTQQYARLAERIRKGQTVLFLGSGISHLYDEDSSDENALAVHLAEEIHYQNFTGGLPSIAEYYQLQPEYGRSNLLENLYKSLQNQPSPNLYDSLARIPTPLVLISSAYDNLLEAAFRQACSATFEM